MLSKEEVLALPVAVLGLYGLPGRPLRVLKEQRIDTIGQLLGTSPMQLMRARGVARVSINQIAYVLRQLAIALPKSWNNWEGWLGSTEWARRQQK